MNTKQLNYVLLIARERSFAKAAEKLGISLPSLSQYVKKIEKEIGMDLFVRLTGDVRLTDAGNIYVDIAEKIINLEHQMQSRLMDISEHKIGSIIVGTSPYRSASMMPQIIRKFQLSYPDIQVIVEEMTSEELLDSTERGKFDFCLTVMPREGLDNRVFSFRKICEEELILAVPASFKKMDSQVIPHRKYPAIDANQINGLKFITITDSQIMQRTLSGICQDYNISISKAAVVKSLEAMISMVKNNVGVALVPSGVESFCCNDEVRYYSFLQDLPRREIVAIWNKGKISSDVTKSLLDIMIEALN